MTNPIEELNTQFNAMVRENTALRLKLKHALIGLETMKPILEIEGYDRSAVALGNLIQLLKETA